MKIKLTNVPILIIGDNSESKEATKLLDDAGIQYQRILASEINPEGAVPLILHQGGVHRTLKEVKMWINFILNKKKVMPDSYIFGQ